MRDLLTRVATVTCWLVIMVLLVLWLVAAVHRGNASAVGIVALALAGVVIVPVLASRLHQDP